MFELPPAQSIFEEAIIALGEAITLSKEASDALHHAEAVASLAEVYYCAASANTRGAGVLQEDFIALSVRAAKGSLQAVDILEHVGESSSGLSARIMKDLGKIYQFLAQAAELTGVDNTQPTGDLTLTLTLTLIRG